MSGSARNDGPPAFVVQNGNSMKYGKVILINGASSSGKTSILHSLQDLLDEPFLEVGIDKFIWMMPGRYLDRPLMG